MNNHANRPIVLISCGKAKLPGRHPAKRLYKSPRFRIFLRYARQEGTPIIVSAKYGLVDPDDVIASYDQKMTRKRFADHVENIQKSIDKLQIPNGCAEKSITIISLLPALYDEVMIAALNKLNIRSLFKVQRPIKGMKMGEQAQWIKKHTKEITLFLE